MVLAIQHLKRTRGDFDSSDTDTYVLLQTEHILSVAGYSHTGMVREHNEDNYLLQDGLLVLCDGMGGHNAGEVASEITCTTFGEKYRDATGKEKSLTALAEEAHNAIRQEVDRDPSKNGMGTTLVAARFDDGKINFTHVGDSRLYRYNLANDTFEQLTEDHSHVHDLFRAGKIREADMKTHRLRNTLSLCVGYENELDTTRMIEPTIDCSVGDVYLLCSDGLLVLDNDTIRKVMKETYAANPHNNLATAQALVAAANAAGGPDNITVVLAQICELPLEILLERGIATIQEDNYPMITHLLEKYDERIRASDDSRASVILGYTYSHQGHRTAARYRYEQALDRMGEQDAGKPHITHTIDALLRIYSAECLEQPEPQVFTYFTKALQMRTKAKGSEERVDAALVQRIAGIGRELIENYTTTTKTSPAAVELEKLARDARIQEIPRVRDAFVSIYTALTERAITAKSTPDAVHFIDCLQAVDSSVSVFTTFIQEGIPHLNYQQARARFAIGEAPDLVLDVLHRFSVEDYNGGAVAVLFLEAQCLQQQGKRKEALAALEQAVRADCNDVKYGVERQDIFVACARHLYVDRNFGRLQALFSEGKNFSPLLDYRIRVIERVYQKCVEATDRNDLKKSREYARQVITVEAGSIDAVTTQHETSVKAAFRIAATYQQELRHREARDAYRQFLKLPQLQDARYSHAEAWYRIAQTYVAEERPEKAKEAATYALRLDPQHPARTFLLH